MDPLRLIVRIAFAYIVLLVFMRLGGKRLVTQASPFDFTLALIVGDLIDDLIWAEVNASAFVIASGVLLLVHTSFDIVRFRAASWR